MPFIRDKDVDNLDIRLIPIIKGCSSESCACLGSCQSVIGQISREDLNNRRKLYDDPGVGYEKLLEDYLSECKKNTAKVVRSNKSSYKVRTISNGSILSMVGFDGVRESIVWETYVSDWKELRDVICESILLNLPDQGDIYTINVNIIQTSQKNA